VRFAYPNSVISGIVHFHRCSREMPESP